MKKIVLTLVCVGFAAASVLAGSCPGGGCGGGDKDKEGSKDKDKTPSKPSLVITLPS